MMMVTCYNCGSPNGVSTYHIVPLETGGTNRPSNQVQLCEACKQKVRESKDAQFSYSKMKSIQIAKSHGKYTGRKGKPSELVEKALQLFANRASNGLSVKDIVQETGVPRATIYAKAKEYVTQLEGGM